MLLPTVFDTCVPKPEVLAGELPDAIFAADLWAVVTGHAHQDYLDPDDRVVRSLGLEPRPPHPKGHVLEDGDWSLLDPVRARALTWRRA
jgi:hypothetical protein